MISKLVTKERVLEQFQLFQGGTGGLDSWLRPETPTEVFDALADLEAQPLSRARLNQLLTLAHEAPVSQPLFHLLLAECPQEAPVRRTSCTLL